MDKPKLTRALADAAGLDAGNRSMREAGRTGWNEEDAEIAALTTNRLCLQILVEEGGLKGVTESILRYYYPKLFKPQP